MTRTGPWSAQQHVEELERTSGPEQGPWPRWYRVTMSIASVALLLGNSFSAASGWMLLLALVALVVLLDLSFGRWAPPRPRRPRRLGRSRRPLTIGRVASWVGVAVLVAGCGLLRFLADVHWPWVALCVASGIVFYVELGRERPEAELSPGR